MKTSAIVEARMQSTRLPGKNLRRILGRPMLEHLLERLGRAQSLDSIIVAASAAEADGEIEALARCCGVACFRGSEHDVLDRVLQAALAHQVELIVEITGDCPLTDPKIVDQAVQLYRERELDFAWIWHNGRPSYPVGFGVRVFSTRLLAEVAATTNDPEDREHVSLYIWKHPEKYRIGHLESQLSAEQTEVWLAVDTAEDFARVSEIFAALYPSNPQFGVEDVLGLLGTRRDLVKRISPRLYGVRSPDA